MKIFLFATAIFCFGCNTIVKEKSPEATKIPIEITKSYEMVPGFVLANHYMVLPVADAVSFTQGDPVLEDAGRGRLLFDVDTTRLDSLTRGFLRKTYSIWDADGIRLGIKPEKFVVVSLFQPHFGVSERWNEWYANGGSKTIIDEINTKEDVFFLALKFDGTYLDDPQMYFPENIDLQIPIFGPYNKKESDVVGKVVMTPLNERIQNDFEHQTGSKDHWLTACDIEISAAMTQNRKYIWLKAYNEQHPCSDDWHIHYNVVFEEVNGKLKVVFDIDTPVQIVDFEGDGHLEYIETQWKNFYKVHDPKNTFTSELRILNEDCGC